MMELIRANRVVKRQSETFMLGPIDLALNAGEILGVTGTRGTGKTTLLRLIWGFLRPDEGSLSVFCLKPHLHQLSVRRNTGYLASSPNFDGRITARCHLQCAARFYEGWDDKASDVLLELFGIHPDACVGDLSDGSKVKLALTAVAGHKPSLLLLDDPVTELEPAVRIEILQYVKKFARENGTGVVISSRQSSELEACADSILTLNAGRITAEHRTSRLLLQ